MAVSQPGITRQKTLSNIREDLENVTSKIAWLLGRRENLNKIYEIDIFHFYASVKHFVKESTYGSNVMEGGHVRFTVYVGERAKCLHCGGVCCIELKGLFIFLKKSNLHSSIEMGNLQQKHYGKDGCIACLFKVDLSCYI